MSANLLGAARWYQRLGLTPIELPYGQKWRNGWLAYQSRQPTDAELEDWFTSGRHNLAVVNGQVSKNACSIDVDDELLFHNILDASGVQRKLVRSLVTVSSRGGHIWLRSRAPVATDLDVAPHIELRGEGTITVVPPSVHPSGARYRIHGRATGILIVEDASTWLRQLLSRLGIRCRDRTERKKPIRPLELLSQPISYNHRNTTLTRIGGYLHNHLPADWTVSLLHVVNEARCEPPLDPHEVDRILHSLSRYPQRQVRPLEGEERALLEALLG